MCLLNFRNILNCGVANLLIARYRQLGASSQRLGTIDSDRLSESADAHLYPRTFTKTSGLCACVLKDHTFNINFEPNL